MAFPYFNGIKADTFLLANPIPVMDMQLFLDSFDFHNQTLALSERLKREKKYRDLTDLMTTAFFSSTAVLSEQNIQKLNAVEVDQVLTIYLDRIMIYLLKKNQESSRQ